MNKSFLSLLLAIGLLAGSASAQHLPEGNYIEVARDYDYLLEHHQKVQQVIEQGGSGEEVAQVKAPEFPKIDAIDRCPTAFLLEVRQGDEMYLHRLGMDSQEAWIEGDVEDSYVGTDSLHMRIEKVRPDSIWFSAGDTSLNRKALLFVRLPDPQPIMPLLFGDGRLLEMRLFDATTGKAIPLRNDPPENALGRSGLISMCYQADRQLDISYDEGTWRETRPHKTIVQAGYLVWSAGTPGKIDHTLVVLHQYQPKSYTGQMVDFLSVVLHYLDPRPAPRAEVVVYDLNALLQNLPGKYRYDLSVDEEEPQAENLRLDLHLMPDGTFEFKAEADKIHIADPQNKVQKKANHQPWAHTMVTGSWLLLQDNATLVLESEGKTWIMEYDANMDNIRLDARQSNSWWDFKEVLETAKEEAFYDLVGKEMLQEDDEAQFEDNEWIELNRVYE